MNTFFTEVRQTLVPRGEVKHGPLPPLLIAMTLVTGLVDAVAVAFELACEPEPEGRVVLDQQQAHAGPRRSADDAPAGGVTAGRRSGSR